MRRRQTIPGFGLVLVLPFAAALAAQTPTPQPRNPLISIWYRGTPAGHPRADDLAVIRALGFGGVTWPADQTKGLEAFKVLAAAAGLEASVVAHAMPLTPDAAIPRGDRLDLRLTTANTDAMSALVWRAVARGTRVVAFDAGAPAGAGLEEADRSLRPWTKRAIEIARQLTTNRRLFATLQPGPGLIVTPDGSPALDLVLLDADRSWLCIATNVSGKTVTADVRFPAGVPYAIWMDLLDGSTLAMLGEPAGPLWSLSLPPFAAKLYTIDKKLK